MPCEHEYVFQMVVYWSGDLLPGGGAHARKYADRYYCKKCLDQQHMNFRVVGNDYSKPIEGTFPK